MGNLDKLNHTLNEKMKTSQPVQIVWAVVTQVDWENKTMTAEGISDELDYPDVSLGIGNLFVKPAVNSSCILGIIENDPTQALLFDAGDVEEYEINVSESKVNITDKFELSNTSTSLLELFEELTDILKQIKVYTGTGPSGVPIASIQNRLNDFQTHFKNLLK